MLTYHPAARESAADGINGVSIQRSCDSGACEPIAAVGAAS